MSWIIVLLAAYVFVGFSVAYLLLLPVGGPQLLMVFSCLAFSVVLADLAVLRRRLSQSTNRLRRRERLLGCPSLRLSRS